MRRGCPLVIGALLAVSPPVWGRGTCTVEGRHALAFEVEVAPADAERFRLRIGELPVTVTPGGIGSPATVEVRGALAFSGSAPADRVPYRTRRAVEASSGLLRLAQGSDQLTLHANVHKRLVDAEIRLPGVVVRGFSLPCDALTLDEVAPAALEPVVDEGGELWAPAGARLSLRGGPGRGGTIEVEPTSGEPLELRRTESAGDWLRLTARWADGTTLAGWARTSTLRRAAPGHAALDETAGRPAACDAEEPRVREGERLSRVAITPGTAVFTERYLGRWATVRAVEPLTVRHRGKDDWVEIVGVPGISAPSECPGRPLDHAWVPRSAVNWPAP